jgi:hypothetical protein
MAISRLTQTTLQNAFQKFNTVWDGTSAVGGMDAIGVVSLSAAASNISFSNIPQTYTHLQLRFILRTSRASTRDSVDMYVNGQTSNTYYAVHSVYGNADNSTKGSSAYVSGTAGILGCTVGYMTAANATTNTFGFGVLDILDYTNTNKNKVTRSLSGCNDSSGGWVALQSSVYLSTSAISSLTLVSENSANFAAYSSVALYGIK